jgi:cob(I)alamin adenosyltransferase
VLRGASCADVRWRILLRVQRDLFVVAADLVANPHHRGRLVPRPSLVVTDMVHDLEDDIDRLTAEHPLRAVFVVPGATPASAALDVARAVVRRAERRVVEMDYQAAERNPLVRTYLNRLSDLLYVLARSAAVDAEELPSHE